MKLTAVRDGDGAVVFGFCPGFQILLIHDRMPERSRRLFGVRRERIQRAFLVRLGDRISHGSITGSCVDLRSVQRTERVHHGFQRDVLPFVTELEVAAVLSSAVNTEAGDVLHPDLERDVAGVDLSRGDRELARVVCEYLSGNGSRGSAAVLGGDFDAELFSLLGYKIHIHRKLPTAYFLDTALQHAIEGEDTFFGITGLVVSQLVQVLVEFCQTFSVHGHDRVSEELRVALSHSEFCTCLECELDPVDRVSFRELDRFPDVLIQRCEFAEVIHLQVSLIAVLELQDRVPDLEVASVRDDDVAVLICLGTDFQILFADHLMP